MSGCSCPPSPPIDDIDPVIEPPTVEAIEIVPGIVHTTAGQNFQLRARIRDSQGQILSDQWGYRPDWEWVESSNTSVIDLISLSKPFDGLRTTGVIPQIANPAPGPVLTRLKIRATVVKDLDDEDPGVVSDDAEVWVVLEDGDRILAEHANGWPPAVAMFEGRVGNDCLNDSLIAYVGVGLPGELKAATATAPCDAQQVAQFSLEREAPFHKVPWSDNADAVNYTAKSDPGDALHQELRPPLEVKVALWFALEFEDDQELQAAKEIVADELKLATSLFWGNRSGFFFTLFADAGQLAPQIIEYWEQQCDPTVAFPRLDGTEEPSFKLPLVHAVYTEVKLAMGNTCVENGQTTIVVDWNKKTHTTLAHELGHAMSLRKDVGHTTDMDDFQPINLMWHVDDTFSGDRAHFSIGQTFRMNMHPRSWLNHATVDPTAADPILVRPPEHDRWSCGADPAADDDPADDDPEQDTPCPRLSIDIVP